MICYDMMWAAGDSYMLSLRLCYTNFVALVSSVTKRREDKRCNYALTLL